MRINSKGINSAFKRIFKSFKFQPSALSPQPSRGFTLLEIMIALAIIGITVTVILSSVNYHADILYENTITTQMYQLAKEKMSVLEETPANSKGKFESAPGFTFENTAAGMEDTDIIQLKTVVKGQGKEVVLKRLIIK